MGLETEYALTVLDRKGKPRSPEDVSAAVMDIARERFAHVESADGQGIFLSNAGKFYIDMGCHPEFATPECVKPDELVRFTLAGDRIMGEIAAGLARDPHVEALAFRGNTGYGGGGDPATWACHESFHCRRHPTQYAEQLVPFLVSRTLFAGSGGFNPHSAGIEFTLSPRSHFLTAVTGTETTRSRPILNLRNEPLTRSGAYRLHLICADALGSQLAMWLRAGVTAIVVGLIDAGVRPLGDLRLADPVAALRAFAADPSATATVPVLPGGTVSAIAIQRSCLAAARDCQSRAASANRLPDWAPTVLDAWECVLNALAGDAGPLDTMLDWRIKQAVYADFAESRGLSWPALPKWSVPLTQLDAARARSGGSDAPLDRLLDEPGPVQEAACGLESYFREHALDWRDLPRVLALRSELLELDTRFLQIGGLFHRLDEQGVLDHRILPTSRCIDDAVHNPPAAGRAALRGGFVREHASSMSHQAGWTVLIDGATRKRASLDDPFATVAEWRDFEVEPSDEYDDEDEDELDLSPMSARMTALSAFVAGDYDSARALLTHVLEAEFEVPSTHCHLARIALVTDDLPAAVLHTRRAWERHTLGPTYVLPRILWLRMAIAMLGSPAEPIAPLLAAMRGALRATESFEWTVAPVLQHLCGRISDRDHALLSALSAVITDRRQMPALEALPEWRGAV